MEIQRVGVARKRGHDTPLLETFVVSPEGLIKHLRYDYNVCSPLLETSITKNQEGTPSINSVSIPLPWRDKGWCFLTELYEADGNPEGMEDYKDWVRAGIEGKLPRVAKDQVDVAGRPVPSDHPIEFPEDLLPSEVRRRRNSLDATKYEWTPPSKRKEAKSGRKAQLA